MAITPASPPVTRPQDAVHRGAGPGQYRGMGGYAFDLSWGPEDERLAERGAGGGSVLASDIDVSGLATVSRDNIVVIRHDLVADLQRAGLDRVAGRAHRSYEPGGTAWAVAQMGLDRMRDQIHRAGASQDDVERIIGSPIVTAWGQRRG
jgi:hypothetical protein